MKKYKAFSFFLFLLLFSAGHISAQDENKNLKTGIELGTGLSYSGFHANLAFVGFYKANTLYIGPKLAFSDTYLPQKGPWGINAGYRRIVISKERLVSFASFDYQLALRAPYNPNDLTVKGLNRIHEFHVNYGFSVKLAKHIWLGNQIGIGAYLEKNIDVLEATVKSFFGYSGHFKIFVQYRL